MAVTFVGKADTVANATEVQAAMPSGLANGDVVLAFVARPTALGSSYTAPGGWPLVRALGVTAGGNDLSLRVHRRTITDASSEPASYTWLSSVVTGWSVTMLVYRGVDTASPVNAENGTTGTTTTITAPSVTTTADGCRVVVAHSSIRAMSDPAGVTMRTNEVASGASERLQVGDFGQASAGATGAKTATIDASNFPGIGATVALKPANNPPNAPTNLSPNGVTIDKDVTQRFSWSFSDPDAGDSQSKYDLQYRPVDTQPWTTVTATTSNTFRDFPAASFAADDYEWQVRTYDALGLVGPYSASAFFTAATTPPGPTITDPVNGQTIPSADYTATISYPDMDSWEWRVLGDDGGNPDETDVIIPATTRPSTTRTFHMQGLPNGVTVHPQVRVLEGGLWSQWVSSTNPVSFTPPAVPSVVASVDSLAGAIVVQATHPEPSGGQPAVVAVDWWRRRLLVDADGLVTGYDPAEGGEDGIPLARGASQLPSAMWTDWQVASGGVYEYRARARGDNETSSWSEWGGGPNAVTWGSNAVTWGPNAVSWS